jgi:hypothetical protein
MISCPSIQGLSEKKRIEETSRIGGDNPLLSSAVIPYGAEERASGEKKIEKREAMSTVTDPACSFFWS